MITPRERVKKKNDQSKYFESTKKNNIDSRHNLNTRSNDVTTEIEQEQTEE